TPPPSVFPPVDGSAKAVIGAPSPFPSGAVVSSECTEVYGPLRDDAERKGKLIREARDRHAPPSEACKLIGAYAQAEAKLVRYLETNVQQCEIPLRIVEQAKNGHKTTEALEKKVCDAAQQMQWRRPGAPPLRRCRPGEYWRDDCVFESDLPRAMSLR